MKFGNVFNLFNIVNEFPIISYDFFLISLNFREFPAFSAFTLNFWFALLQLPDPMEALKFLPSYLIPY